jgi:two-component system sensor histidine kinase RegB
VKTVYHFFHSQDLDKNRQGFESTPGIVATEITKSAWIFKWRWWSIGFYFLASIVAFQGTYLNARALINYLALLSIYALIHFLTEQIFIKKMTRIHPHFNFFQLAIDLIFWSLVVSLSGGYRSPLFDLILVIAAMAGLLINNHRALSILILIHSAVLALQLAELQNPIPNFLATDGPRIISQALLQHLVIFLAWMSLRLFGFFLDAHLLRSSQLLVQKERNNRLRALGAMAAGFSHEFASPLNAARLRLDRLERRLQQDSVANPNSECLTDLKMQINEILNCISTCESTIKQMNASQLHIQNPTEGKLFKTIYAKEFVTQVVSSWVYTHPTAKVELNIASDLIIEIVTVNFAQVLINLLDNAFEASPETSIHLQLEKMQNQIQLIIDDLGPGFPPSVLNRQGEPFVSTKASGTGLGLYVSDLFAQSLDGRLMLENRKPFGARVHIKWPTVWSPETQKPKEAGH